MGHVQRVYAIDYYAVGRHCGRTGPEPPFDVFALGERDRRAFALGCRDGRAAVDAEGSCEHCPAAFGPGVRCAVCGRAER
jgi:hypothetical protein